MEKAGPSQYSEALRLCADLYGPSPAVLAPGRLPLTYSRLYEHLVETVRTLNSLGIGRKERLAVVAPSGVESGIAQAISATATAVVPINPASSLEECKALFSRIKVNAVIIQEGTETAAWQAAEQLGLLTITLTPLLDQPTGIFRLSSQRTDITPIPPDSDLGGFASLDDITVFVLTSGTTAASKIIPYTQRNLYAQLSGMTEFFDLGHQDRLLSILPTYHGAGIGYVRQSLMYGGTMLCLPGFEVKTFFQYLEEFKPTWFVAVTPIYQAILDHAANYPNALANSQLRFTLAASMALEAERTAELEKLLKVPILQMYGASESGFISANPLPPRHRKLGSSGLPCNIEVGIVDDNLRFLPTGETGEVVVRGPGVMPGYVDDPEGTASVFFDGWYRTGDLGYLDTDGYLFIVGRVKEVINRGGQKVSPGEVEQALLAHPQVKQAAAFALPDPRLGDEVGAAVILRTPGAVTEMGLRSFASQNLTPYKVPRRIAFVDELPRNAIGKVQRLGLAQKLGLTLAEPSGAGEFVLPRTDTEQRLAQLWVEVLGCNPERVSVNARFADLGGVSLSAAHLVFKAREAFGVHVTILDLFDASTIAEQAVVIDKLLSDPAPRPTGQYLIPIQATGAHPPLYCLPALEGGVYFYRELVPYLSPDQPVYGLLAVGMDDGCEPQQSIEDMAAHHFQQIKGVQLRGPYYLCGYSFGGRVALETARLLHEDGHDDTYVFMIDDQLQVNAWYYRAEHTWRDKADSLLFGLRELEPLHRRLYLQQRVKHYAKRITGQHKEREPNVRDVPLTVQRVIEGALHAAHCYVPRPYNGHVRYVFGIDNEINIPLFKTLKHIGAGDFTILSLRGRHTSLLVPPNVEAVGGELQRWLNECQKVTA